MKPKTTKHRAQFKAVPANINFHTARYPDCEVDSISLYKEKADDKTASNSEWGTTAITPEQPCWWFTEN